MRPSPLGVSFLFGRAVPGPGSFGQHSQQPDQRATVQPVIGVVFYSTFGHVAALAEEVIKGAEAAGAIVKPYVIQETLSETILGKMHAGSSLKPKYPVITPNDLKELDGFLLGAPTRYGRLPAQVDAFFDQTGGLWATGALVGKFVGTFTSTAGQHSGQESTHITTFPFFAHHGLAYVPIGYTDPSVGNVDQVQGGSPYGASVVAAADGHLQPTANDLKVAAHQGSYFATFVGTFVKGKNAITAAAGNSAPIAAGTTSTEPASEVPATKEGESSAAPAVGAAGVAGAGAAGTAAVASKNTNAETPVADSTTAPVTGDKAVTPESKPVDGTTGATAASTEKPVDGTTGSTATPAEKPAAGAAATTADKPAGTKPAQKKKKSGGFLGCCGGSNID
ncbi:NAD(P)H:quinone oxidoreductase, type IV [Cryptococcus amylolentus CBS 6039]|uniref:NAD(P)H:quinone oxidoreductase, type IV n=1 Tax=Cryptococcus amylolentus CBS 6039 TaxID=1295533 RepID=A0A1E3I678_9TREE|nr:NAD(P)H:quinone oxidoreductase, type IV [Cryptococcus amylolentus CBS 6039]ODN83336.1 NAD(P)H:quinone oxidoreductase, type IV [Cryptococcus amylolentus CBS 6039]